MLYEYSVVFSFVSFVSFVSSPTPFMINNPHLASIAQETASVSRDREIVINPEDDQFSTVFRNGSDSVVLSALIQLTPILC